MLDEMIDHDYKRRMRRAEQKRQVLLDFLSEEIWTMPDIIALLLSDGKQVLSRQNIHALVKRLATLGYLKVHKPTVDESDRRGKRLVYVGITRAGRIEVGADPEGRVFEPSKLRDFSLDHRLYQQKVRILGGFRGWIGWQGYQRRTGTDENGDDLPPWPIQADYVTMIEGQRVAIEAERTLKSARRYSEIWRLHAEAVENGRWNEVLYILPKPQVKAAFDTLRARDRIGSSDIFRSMVIDELAIAIKTPFEAALDEFQENFKELGLNDPPQRTQDDEDSADEYLE